MGIPEKSCDKCRINPINLNEINHFEKYRMRLKRITESKFITLINEEGRFIEGISIQLGHKLQTTLQGLDCIGLPEEIMFTTCQGNLETTSFIRGNIQDLLTFLNLFE